MATALSSSPCLICSKPLPLNAACQLHKCWIVSMRVWCNVAFLFPTLCFSLNVTKDENQGKTWRVLICQKWNKSYQSYVLKASRIKQQCNRIIFAWNKFKVSCKSSSNLLSLVKRQEFLQLTINLLILLNWITAIPKHQLGSMSSLRRNKTGFLIGSQTTTDFSGFQTAQQSKTENWNYRLLDEGENRNTAVKDSFKAQRRLC